MFILRYIVLLFIFFHVQVPNAISQDKKAVKAVVDDIFGDLPINDAASHSYLNAGETAKEKIRKNIFVTALLNKTKCYTGEPVLLSFELLSSLKSTTTIQSMPTFVEFLLIPTDPNNDHPKFRQQQGLTFSVYTIKQLQLIPSKEGNIEIGSIITNNEINYTKDNKNYSYSGVVKSNPITLMVKPLPEAGRPVNFNGTIGDFDILASVKIDSFPAGENNLLEIEITGSGNFYSLPSPAVSWPVGFHNFEPKVNSVIDEKIFPVKGIRTISIPFIADKGGEFTIPPIELNFFDPSSNRYRKVVTNAIRLFVIPAIVTSKVSSLNAGTEMQQTPKSFVWLYIIVASSVFLGVVIFALSLIRKRKDIRKARLNQEFENLRAVENMRKLEANSFSSAISNLKNLELNENYMAHFKQVLMDYLRWRLANTAVLPEEMVQSVKTIDFETGTELEKLIEQCNQFLYARISPDETTRGKQLSILQFVVNRLNGYPN
ncbi:MAG: BatD family protein [Ferruginibacter sp.]